MCVCLAVLQALADCGVLDKIKRVAGSSVGAICGTLVAVGCSAQEVADLFAGDDHYVQWMFHGEITNLFNPSPAVTVYTRVEARFKTNKMPLKLIK